ncbi:MAG: hypothetical protein JW878_04765 [Methanomicrobia archaeon]|nr:hypothetical protein [Methanomicrobia archaeon]
MSGSKSGGLNVKRVALGFLLLLMGLTFCLEIVVPLVLATTVPGTQEIDGFDVNYDNISIKLDGEETSTVLIGQEIQFYNRSGGSSGMVTLIGISGDAEDHPQNSETNGRLDTTSRPLKTGTYTATCASGCNDTTIIVEEPYMNLKLKRDGETIDRIPVNSDFTVSLSTNLDKNDGVTLEVTDPGEIKHTDFERVNVDHLTDLVIPTSGWELGTWTFKIVTEEDYARGLDEESNEVELEVVSGELEIEAKKTEVVELENVQLTVTGMPGLDISISVDRNADYAIFPAKKNDNPSEDNVGSFDDTIEPEGEMRYVVYFSRTGAYTVRVEDLTSDAEAYVDIAVAKKKVTFSMPETCAIGSDLVVSGTANTGNTVDIAIDDIIVKNKIAIDNDGAFEVKLPTPKTSGTGTDEDAITIKAFISIDPEGGFALGDDVSGEEYDGSTMVLMVTGSLTAESSTSVISPGDSFTLSGTALGSKWVDVLIVAPKGGGGNGINPPNSELNELPSGIVYETASVSGGTYTWSIESNVQEDADTGTYLAFVLTPGKNQIYDKINDDDLLTGIADSYFDSDLSKLAAKTQEQIKSILQDATTEAAGSDDFMKVVKIDVGRAEIALRSLPDVVIGDDLVITGISNREGHTIIVKVQGPINLESKFAKVADGKFNATFSTSEALTGEYTVEADDGEGHTDTKTVNIITPIRTEALPTSAPTSSATPTTTEQESESIPTTSPENSEAPTSSPQLPVPGFEIVGVIFAVVAVYLIVFVRREERGD